MVNENIYEKFDKMYDTEELAKEIKEYEQNGSNFTAVPYGSYEVAVEKMELTQSKACKPMVTIWFKILNGEYKGSLIFYNQVIVERFGLHKANEFLRSMDTGLNIEFKNFAQYAQLLMDVHEAIDGKLEFGLNYSEGKKGYPVFEITDVFEVE
jgi:hypothetical protein